MKTAILLLMMIAMVSCSKQSSKSDVAMYSAPSLKISVLSDGAILTDGKATTIPELDQALVNLKKAGGTVWYYREAGKQEPPSQAMEVIKLVAGKSLPITLSSKADFSDYVGQDGQSHPRER
jgi:hypothetical protein